MLYTQLALLTSASGAQYVASASPEQTDANVELNAALFYGVPLTLVERSGIEAVLTA
jgi:hypothetical protein